METKPKNRAWVKDAAIVFLVVLLLLTFFSNTIMNHSLPEVATNMVSNGTITAKVRGTGTVTANGNHKVKAKSNMTIGRVVVKAGQEVNAGDVLFVLGAADSTELEEAMIELEDLQTQYAQAALSVPLADSFTDEQIELRKANEAIEAAKKAVKNAEKDVEQAKADMGQNGEVTERVNYLLEQKEQTEKAIASKTKQRDDLQIKLNSTKEALDKAKQAYNDIRARYLFPTPTPEPTPTPTPQPSPSTNPDPPTTGEGTTGNETNNLTVENETPNVLARVFARVGTQGASSTFPDDQPEVIEAKAKVDQLEKQYNDELNASTGTINSLQYDIDTLTLKLKSINAELETWSGDSAGLANLAAKQKALEEANNDLQKARDTLATKTAELQYSMANQERSIASASAGLGAISNKIKRQQEKIKKLSGEGDENTITANVSGTVTEVNCTAGDSVVKDDILASIEVPDQGYTVSFSVTNDQAKRLHVGDTATISNYYWGNKIVATLATIQTDKKNPMTNKTLTFDLEGDVTSGSEITVSVGQKSANYDTIIPNSAIRTDSNGSFVLAVTAKNSPLGNRYIAKRVAIEVLAADDTNSAVTADLNNGDYVITTSSAPVASGDMVRLADAEN